MTITPDSVVFGGYVRVVGVIKHRVALIGFGAVSLTLR